MKNRAEHLRRRKNLMQQIGSDGIVIIATAPIRQRNRDVDHQYRPDSDFFYLTGFEEPEAVAVLIPGREPGEFIIFCRERDPKMETWDGYRAGLEGAREIYGADDAFPITDIDDILPGLMEGREKVYYAMGCNTNFDQQVLGWLNQLKKQQRAGVHAPGEIIALDHLLHEMRLFKSTSEIRSMRRAAQISADAHRRAMQFSRPGVKEYQVEAEIIHTFMQNGARSAAYPSIVGGGGNSCILHYIENSETLKNGELLLIDAGAEYDYYAADITRTFPVNGRFSRAQRKLYQVVLNAQHAAIEQVKPGNHWNQPHEAAVQVLTEGLVELGLLKGRISTLIKNGAYKKFYMHRTGHWLGMDVHDVGEYKEGDVWRTLEPGMVLTIEPGLYIPADSKKVDKKWWNIGIRIEDDVLVTKDGYEVLSAGIVKEIDEIEALMAGAAA
ncbi:MAG: Xaa-Pro aminopeptidase [Gammaproteobacteria bacterium]|nr:Xaa-Pro aminopeptidase [Gammaproteobacteria bacterium]